jgi:ribosome biogenesis SPOUT family RNA methylase Rps3
VIVLDQLATEPLQPKDAEWATILVCGGILGTDEFEGPVVNRTMEITEKLLLAKEKGIETITRHLNTVQMTSDTAMLVSMNILIQGKKLNELEYIDKPTFPLTKRESVEMPFRYLKNPITNEPMIPDGMIELWKKDPF